MSYTYYPIREEWEQLYPYFKMDDVAEEFRSSMKHYSKVIGRSAEYDLPKHFDVSNERYTAMERQNSFTFGLWDYVCFGACHWLCNALLMIAQRYRPDNNWRIITCDYHTTVMDIDNKVFFDANYYSFEVPAQRLNTILTENKAEALDIGQYLTYN